MKLILYGIASLCNISLWIFTVVKTFKTLYRTALFLTFINFTASSFYLLAMFIYELRIYLARASSKKKQTIQHDHVYLFIRDRLFKLVFTLNLTVCIGYWALLLGGQHIMPFSWDVMTMVRSIWVHLLIGIMIVVELLYTDRTHYEEHFIKDYIICTVFMFTYCFVLTIVTRLTEIKVYPFLNLELTNVIGIYLVLFMISFNVYQLFHYIMSRRQKPQNSPGVPKSPLISDYSFKY